MHITVGNDTELQEPGAQTAHGTRRRTAASTGSTARPCADILLRAQRFRPPPKRTADLPGFRLHPLKGAYTGFWAVTVRANWRVVFRFEDGHAADIDYLDYH